MANKAGSDWDTSDTISVDDMRINKSYYLHIAITNAQQALAKGLDSGQKNDGIMLFILYVKQLESLVRASGFLEEDFMQKYREDVKIELETLGGAEEMKGLEAQAFKATAQFGVLLRLVFDSQMSDVTVEA